MATPFTLVSRDAAQALTEFSDEFRDALVLGPITPWAETFGHVRRTDALKTVFPIPVSAAGYHEFKGDMKFRSLYERSMSMISKTWQDGVAELAAVVEAPDFSDWNGEPTRMAHAWARQPNLLVASLLATSSYDGPLLDFYRDPDTNTASTRRLFANDHPVNILQTGLGSFQNYGTTTVAKILDGTAFEDIDDTFRQIKGPDGNNAGLSLSGGNLLIPNGRFNLFKKALETDTLIRHVDSAGAVGTAASVVAAVTQQNLNKGTVGYTVASELTHNDYFYAFASGMPGCYPWVVQQASTLEEIIHDKQSDFYKRSLKVAFASIGKLNAAFALPHTIYRVQITG
jgi:hypothetical protein